MLQSADLALIHMDAVRRQHLGIEQSLFLDVGDYRHAVFLAHGFHFEAGFGQVRMQGHVDSAASCAVARRISGVQVYGACGATEGTISACPSSAG